MKRFIIISIIAVFIVTGVQAFAHDRDRDRRNHDRDEVEIDIFAPVDETQPCQPCDKNIVSVELGLILASELDSIMFADESLFADEFLANKIPGLYVEVMHGNIGYGFTGLVRFTKTPSSYAFVAQEWHLYWIGSFDFRYHFFGTDSFIDPTVELGLGCAGSIDLPVYDEYGMEYKDADITGLSIFAQAGCGFALNFDGFVVGTKAVYRFHNEAPPATAFAPVELSDFQYSVSLGVRF